MKNITNHKNKYRNYKGKENLRTCALTCLNNILMPGDLVEGQDQQALAIKGEF